VGGSSPLVGSMETGLYKRNIQNMEGQLFFTCFQCVHR
jgi:hypothetical protein